MWIETVIACFSIVSEFRVSALVLVFNSSRQATSECASDEKRNDVRWKKRIEQSTPASGPEFKFSRSCRMRNETKSIFNCKIKLEINSAIEMRGDSLQFSAVFHFLALDWERSYLFSLCQLERNWWKLVFRSLVYLHGALCRQSCDRQPSN